MPTVMPDLLAPSFVMGVISRVEGSPLSVSKYFGTQIGGANVERIRGRVANYDIMDRTRRVAEGRAPNAPAGTVALQKIGSNNVALGDFKEKIQLDYDKLIAIRQLGKGAGDLDIAGVRYIEEQVSFLKERQENAREAITASIFRGGKYGFWRNNERFVVTYAASPDESVDLKMEPTWVGNINGSSFSSTLQMGSGADIITASWATASTDIPAQLMAISARFLATYGTQLAEIHCGSDVWLNVINNDKVRQIAGTATSSAEYELVKQTTPQGGNAGVIYNRIKALPWIRWVVNDNTLELATTNINTFDNVKLIPPNTATFVADLGTNSPLKMAEGSEFISEGPNLPPVERTGFYSYGVFGYDPAVVWYYAHQRIGIMFTRTKAIANARVQ